MMMKNASEGASPIIQTNFYKARCPLVYDIIYVIQTIKVVHVLYYPFPHCIYGKYIARSYIYEDLSWTMG